MAHLLGLGIAERQRRVRSKELNDILGVCLTLPVDEKQPITGRWVPRTLVLTNVSLSLFHRARDSFFRRSTVEGTPPSGHRRSFDLRLYRHGSSGSYSTGSSDGETNFDPLGSDLKRSLALAEVFNVHLDGETVRISSLNNGKIAQMRLRCSSEAAVTLNHELQRLLRAYSAALELLKSRWIVSDGRPGFESLALVTRRRHDEATEVVIGRNTALGAECTLGVVAPDDELTFIVATRWGAAELKLAGREALAAASAVSDCAVKGQIESVPVRAARNSMLVHLAARGDGGGFLSSLPDSADSSLPPRMRLGCTFSVLIDGVGAAPAPPLPPLPLSAMPTLCPPVVPATSRGTSSGGGGGSAWRVTHLALLGGLMLGVAAAPEAWLCRPVLLAALATLVAAFVGTQLLVNEAESDSNPSAEPPAPAATAAVATTATAATAPATTRRVLSVRVDVLGEEWHDEDDLPVAECEQAESSSLSSSSVAAAAAGGGEVAAAVVKGKEEDVDVAALRLPDEALPDGWVSACEGDRVEAMRRWRGSLKWRAKYHVSQYLSRPQPHFATIKSAFKHAFLGVDTHGNLVTLEVFGGIRSTVRQLTAQGITSDDFASHMVFLNEYFLRNLVPAGISPTAKQTKVIDLMGVGLSDARKEVKSFLDRTNFELQQYPELLHRIYLVNVPAFFALLWRVVAPLLPSKTRKKITVVGVDPDGIKRELVDSGLVSADSLPVEYGGTQSLPIEECSIEVRLRKYIDSLAIAG